jgi:nicotinate-nucleotide pyrophosphorylase (carboxylating)
VSATDPGALTRARAELVQVALEEDIGEGDWTTEWTVEAGSRSRAVIVAKQTLVAAGTMCVLEVFRVVDPDLEVELVVDDGARVADGDVMVHLSGGTRAILTGERTALNFLGRLSGIATLTRAFVDAVTGTGAQIIDTRKTTPGWRLLEKSAVRAGGGANHRVGLYDMVLVKDNHADARGGVAEAVRAALSQNTRSLPVEAEVRTLEELDEVLRLGVDRVLLDNMSLETMQEAVRRALALGEGRPKLEASGNVTLSNVRAVAETGVDLISVGALTHSAPTADVSLRMTR